MSKPFDAEKLLAASAIHPECEGLAETEQEWWLGMISVPKSNVGSRRAGEMPTYRRGWEFQLEEGMDFVSIPFSREGGQPALAVVLRGRSEEFLAGWFRGERQDEVARAVSLLNHEIEAERHRCRAESTISMAVGSEFAPDAPFGVERLVVWSDGRVSYVRRQRGATWRTEGRVSPGLWTTLGAALNNAQFPQPLAKDLSPGGAVMSISTTGPDAAGVTMDYYDALEARGYDDIAQFLGRFTTALRTNDTTQLATWGFEPAPDLSKAPIAPK